ncbi:MAG: hypothetical protein H6734_06710 [Alphaproteobacteria bacterium]|nr:hypothetical protein [Alphaproteobacteria bacterium]
MSALLLLLACDPLSPVAREEAVWWGPTAAIEAREGIDLVELPAGEPVGYWPRIVVYADRIEVDTRAWWLSVPPSAYDALGRQGVLEAMVASKVVASVVDGQVPADQKRGQLITGLYEVLLAQAEARKALAQRTGDPDLEFHGRVLIVPDASASVELLREALYTAGQAQFGGSTFAGAMGGRLRAASASSDVGCAQQVVVDVVPAGVHILAGGVPIQGDPCPLPLEALPGQVSEVFRACEDLYDAIATEVAAAHPTVSPIDPSEWRCTQALVHLGGDTTASDLLPAVASLHALHPRVDQGQFIGGPDSPSPARCTDRVSMAALAPDSLSRLCVPANARARLEMAYSSLEAGQGLHRWAPRRLPRPVWPSTGGPAWSARASVPGAGPEAPPLVVVRRHQNQLAYCVQRLVAQEAIEAPKPFTIQVHGELVDGRFTNARIEGAGAAESCIAGRFTRMQFPEELSGPLSVELDLDQREVW